MSRRIPTDIEDVAIRASLDVLLNAERSLIEKRVPEIVNELDDTPSLWLCLQPPYTPSQSLLQNYITNDEEPYFRLAGLLGLLHRSPVPPELHMRGLTIRIRGDNAHFCISGSISLDDLRKLCERFPDRPSAGQ